MFRSTRTAVPTYRAGTNMRDPTRSGFARVSVIDQQDLFPHEGYEFPADAAASIKPPTNSYRISEDSPFTNKFQHSSAWRAPTPDAISQCMNTMMKTERVCNMVASKAISTPSDGELRPLHSQIATEAIKKEREVQMRVREQMKIQSMKDEAYWAQLEHEQGLQTHQVHTNYKSLIKSQQKSLARDYENQFALQRKRRQEEQEQERQELEKLKQLQKEEDEKEKQRQARLKQIAEERKKEFQAKNEEILNRRKIRIEKELEEEKIIQKQHEEAEERQQLRQTWEKQRRDEKNRMRDRIIADQTKRLAEIKAKETKFQAAAESDVAKRDEERRQAEIQKRKDMTLQRNREYREFVKQKELAKSQKKEVVPDFTKTDEDDYRAAEEQIRAKRMKSLRLVQQEQARQRKEKERQERQDQLNEATTGDTMYFLKDSEW